MRDHLLVLTICRVLKARPDVFPGQEREIRNDRLLRHARSEILKHVINRYAHASYAWFTAALSGFYCDDLAIRFHVQGEATRGIRLCPFQGRWRVHPAGGSLGAPRPNVALTGRDGRQPKADARPDPVERLDPRGPRSGPLGQGAERSERHDPAREAGRIDQSERPRPVARLVPPHEACRGSAVRSTLLLAVLSLRVHRQATARDAVRDQEPS
jgi:hypothetical protein